MFDRMAPAWYRVRHWPLLQHELEEISRRWRHGRVVNLGCGHGADFLPFRSGFDLVGLDHSIGMLFEARRYMAKHGFRAGLVRGDLSHLPFGDSSFDYAIAIASYHHVEGAASRKEALAELRRILRPAGEAFLSVWNYAQPRFHGTPRDQLVPWCSEGVRLQRYYHLFTVDELHHLLAECGFEIARIGHGMQGGDPAREDIRNICALVRKPAA